MVPPALTHSQLSFHNCLDYSEGLCFFFFFVCPDGRTNSLIREEQRGLRSHNRPGSKLTICYHQHLLLLDLMPFFFKWILTELTGLSYFLRTTLHASTSSALTKTSHKRTKGETAGQLKVASWPKMLIFTEEFEVQNRRQCVETEI